MTSSGAEIPGVASLPARRIGDARGWFVKTFHASDFAAAGLRTDWTEGFVSASAKGVLRGMHFQAPPMQHAKAVTCLSGAIIDVVLDLRRGSPAYGQWQSFRLGPDEAVMGLYVPSGCAHGFLAIDDDSIVSYQVTSVHSPAHDLGIRWDSFNFAWPVTEPLLSARDARHPPLADFDSPFTFDARNPAR